MIKSDLEALLEVKVRGDVTALVYTLLKDSKDKESLLAYSHMLMDKELTTKIRKGAKLLNVNNQKTSHDTSDESIRRPSFKDWASNREFTN